MVSQAATTLAQMIPVVVLSGAITSLAKQAVPRETAIKSFSEISREGAIAMVGRDSVNIAKKNPDTIFHTSRGEVMYSDGRYFIR